MTIRVQYRRRMPRPITVREDERRDAAIQARAEANAVARGWCGSCGVTVREDGLHASDCPDVPTERRRAS